MAGLSLPMSGVSPTPVASWSPQTGMNSVTQAAFGPGVTVDTSTSMADALHPTQPTGMAVWVGIGALAGLVALRHSLPN